MGIVYEADTARFIDACTVEEALDLLEWVRSQPTPRLDLDACSHLHTALFQVIAATRPAVTAPPRNPFLRRCLTSTLRAPTKTVVCGETDEHENDPAG